jgi:hypothetical protein
MWGLAESFAHFGAIPRNPRWAWSARGENVVVVTWWKDEKGRDGDKFVYDLRGNPRLPLWQGRHGNRDRIKNLVWARDHCDGLFRVVWIKTNEPDDRIRKTIERYPDDRLWMRLEALNEHTGEFLARQVEHA